MRNVIGCDVKQVLNQCTDSSGFGLVPVPRYASQLDISGYFLVNLAVTGKTSSNKHTMSESAPC